MTGNTSDGHIDRLVKAGWLKIGLSQSDLAEVLDAALQQQPKQNDGHVDADRLLEVGQALGMPVDAFYDRDGAADRPDPERVSAEPAHSMLSLLELRLLRAFCQLRDHRTKRLLIHLAEQIVKRQTDGHGGNIA
jgi:hypothetical protein